ncbi:hypothetical protein E4T48_05294 [Aureobasidium sp. EXF-10727]|nr:hypothetical protein E4T48_05294 [Aureobasidium sp. EXF-10727]
MDYQQSCVTTGACHQPVYAQHNQGYTHAHPVWTTVPQYPYGYEQHTLVPPVGNTYVQAPIMTPSHTAPAEPIAVDGHRGYATVPPGQPLIYRNGIEAEYGQPTSPIEFNVDELLEYQRRRSSATSEEKEPLTPAQRRRKAQNRAAQRAFRDRKRQRVQELEAQLSALEVRTNSLETDNERLKHELVRTREENEILRRVNQPLSPSNTLQPGRRMTTTKSDGSGIHLPAQ